MYASWWNKITSWASSAYDTVKGWVNTAVDKVSDTVSGWWQDIIDYILEKIYKLFYEIDALVCKVLRALYNVFKVFVGMDKAEYKGSEDYLINIFTNNSTLSRAFWGMAALGVTITFILTIWAVIKQTFNLEDRQDNSLGKILRTCGTSILLIFSMTFIFQMTNSFSGVLLQQIDLVFDTAQSDGTVTDIVFDDEDYATMARIFDTIGDYSLNDSSSSSYNVNACFNDIRFDLQVLDNKHFFDLTYTTYDTDGYLEDTWQAVIARIGRAHSIDSDQPLDQDDEALDYAIVYAMDYLTNSSENTKILTEYHENAVEFTSQDPSLDTVVFLTGTTSAARNSEYNNGTGIYDALRKPYITGEKTIYSYSQVHEDFDLAFDSFDHLLIIVGACYLIYLFVKICIDAVVRLYSLLLLYIVSPFFIATRPVDGNKRFENWKDAFIVTLFSMYGTIISIRLFMLLVPIILSSDLVIVGGGFVGAVAKLVFILGSAYACREANDLIGHMLATSQAGGMSIGTLKQASGQTYGAMKTISNTAIGVVKAVGGMGGGSSYASDADGSGDSGDSGGGSGGGDSSGGANLQNLNK